MAVTFVNGATTITFPADQNREYPLDDELAQRGSILRTAVNVPKFNELKSADPLVIPLKLSGVSQAFYDDLENFFYNVVEGALYQFNYTNGVTGESNLPVRWINGFDFTDGGKYYSGIIILQKEII